MVKRSRLAKGWVRVEAMHGCERVTSDEIPAGMVKMFKLAHPKLKHFKVVKVKS